MNQSDAKMYAVLAAVGDYQDMDIVDLPAYQLDLSFMVKALTQGLRMDPDHIRVLGEKGKVTVREFAIALKNFSELLTEEDTLIFYFSGHGIRSGLAFSDAILQLESVLTYVNAIHCKSKLIILDCCYSGGFGIEGPKQLSIEDTIRSFVGSGIAIMASSAADEVSRMGMQHSLYTELVGTAMMNKRQARKGYLSLDAINSDVFYMMEIWNRQHPERKQHPIFRSSMGGTMYFRVAEYIPYKQKDIYIETDRYTIYSAKPLSTGRYKRMAVFVIYHDKDGLSALPDITCEIAGAVKYEKIFSSEKGEQRFGNRAADAIWCYFGYDESDIIHHLHYAYTIWAANDEMKKLYYKENRYTQVTDGICIYRNPDYAMLKKMQAPTVSREEFIAQNKQLLAEVVSMAERFVRDLQEIANRTISVAEVQEKYKEWIQTVRRTYILLSDMDVAPDDLYAWSNEIYDLAGWVLDLSLLLEGRIGERELWLINNSVRLYHESLEKLKGLEEEKFSL